MFFFKYAAVLLTTMPEGWGGGLKSLVDCPLNFFFAVSLIGYFRFVNADADITRCIFHRVFNGIGIFNINGIGFFFSIPVFQAFCKSKKTFIIKNSFSITFRPDTG